MKQSLTITGKPRAAFTLVEMLVAAAIASVLVVIVAQVASTGLRSVGVAGGRMVASEKMHRLRSQLAADLQAVASPEVAGSGGEAVLQVSRGAAETVLTLRLPQQGGGEEWKRVVYRHRRDRQTIERLEPGRGAVGDTVPVVLVSGVVDWRIECLAKASDASGEGSWDERTRLPAALLFRAQFTTFKESGGATVPPAIGQTGQDYEWRQNLLAGGGGGRL